MEGEWASALGDSPSTNSITNWRRRTRSRKWALGFRVMARAARHFLHHSFIVSQHYFTKSGEVFRSQPRNKFGKSRVQGRDTLRETELAEKKAIY
jgi:hypothetical protein